METKKVKSQPLIPVILRSILLLCFINFIASAQELSKDTFTSSADGWTGRGVSVKNNQLNISHDRTALKTFNFGSSYANTGIEITFDYKTYGKWESSGFGKDYIEIYFNGTKVGQISKK